MKDNGVGDTLVSDNLDVRLEKAKKELNDLKKELAKKKKQLEKAKEKIEIAQKKLDELKKQPDMSLKKTKNNDRQKVASLKNINDKDHVKIDYTANPLDTNDIFGKIISKIKKLRGREAIENKSMYSLITEFKDKDSEINDEEYSKLCSMFDTSFSHENGFVWFKIDDYIISTVTKRIYVNVQNTKLHEFVRKFYESMENDHSDLRYMGKCYTMNQRSDGLVIYTNDKYFNDVLGVVAGLYENDKDLFEETFDNSMTTAKTGIPGVGVSSEPVEEETSHNLKMSHIFERSLAMAALRYASENKEFADKYKKVIIDNIYPQEVEGVIERGLDKAGGMEELCSVLQNALLSSRNRLDGKGESDNFARNGLVEFPVRVGLKMRMKELTELGLFNATWDAIYDLKDTNVIKKYAEDDIRTHADFYNINSDNIAFRIGEDPRVLLNGKGFDPDETIDPNKTIRR